MILLHKLNSTFNKYPAKRNNFYLNNKNSSYPAGFSYWKESAMQLIKFFKINIIHLMRNILSYINHNFIVFQKAQSTPIGLFC